MQKTDSVALGTSLVGEGKAVGRPAVFGDDVRLQNTDQDATTDSAYVTKL